MQHTATKQLVLYAVFVGMIFLLGLTPLGFITLPIAAITTVHVPVIVGAYRFGPKGGAILGFFFGLTSLISCFLRPDAIAAIVLGTNSGFGIYNLLLIVMILFVPRVLVGVFSALIYNGLRRKNETVAMGVAAFCGSMANTILLLGGLYLFAFQATGTAFGLAEGFTAAQFLKILLGIVTVNGVVEALAAVLICTALGRAQLHFMERAGEKK